MYHGDGAGETAEAEFAKVFRAHEAPTDVPEHAADASEAVDGRIRLANVLRQAGLVSSNKEGARMIGQGAVRLDGEVVADADATYAVGELGGVLVQVGKRRWARIAASGG
jgi:tyrosyl-tRNA synthetase